jgi:hypothetical protein
LKNLKIIKLDYTAVDDKGVESLKGLPQLSQLSLDSTGVTDQGVQWLRSMAGLKQLNLYHTLITEKGFADLKAALPECKVVFDRDSALPSRRGRS